MANPLLVRATPRQLAEQRQVIEFKGELKDFPGLAAIVETDLAHVSAAEWPDGWRRRPVEAGLAFGFADARQAVPQVTGRVGARLDAVCQRCLEVFELPVEAELRYLLLAPGAAAEEYEDFEAWELDDKRFRPLDVVEEALIMALPLASVHAEECTPLTGDEAGSRPETVRPFAGLKDRLKQGDH